MLLIPTLTIRCQHSLALVVFLARCLFNGHYRTPRCTVALGFRGLGNLGGLGGFNGRQLFFYPTVLLFFYLFLFLLVLLFLLLLGFDNGALGQCGELLVYSFKLMGERKTDESKGG